MHKRSCSYTNFEPILTILRDKIANCRSQNSVMMSSMTHQMKSWMLHRHHFHTTLKLFAKHLKNILHESLIYKYTKNDCRSTSASEKQAHDVFSGCLIFQNFRN